VAGATAVVLALDQLSKEWALSALRDGPMDLVWTLRLNLTFNSGAAFGLARGLAPVLMVVGVVLVVLLAGAGKALIGGVGSSLALGMVLGGAAGNLSDRFFRGHGGAVVDFIDLQWWPVFNVADAAITCGALWLVVTRTAPGGDGDPASARWPGGADEADDVGPRGSSRVARWIRGE
jgi:signal peptidase II